LASTANGGVLSTSILLGTNGGTSNGFFSITGPATSLKTFTFPNASATVLTSNTPVTVAQGGTGVATLTANSVLLGEGTSNVSSVALGADTVLRGTASADPIAAAVNNCGDATHALSYNTTTHAFGCQAITSGGTGTVTSVAAGTGITASPSPIVGSGTISLDLTATNTWTGRQTFSGGSGAPGYVTGAAAASALFEFAGNAQTAGTTSLAVGQDTSGDAAIIQRANRQLYLSTNGSQRVTVSGTGRINFLAQTSTGAAGASFNGLNNADTVLVQSGTTTSQGFGLRVQAGTNASDYSFLINNASNGTTLFEVFGDGGTVVGSPTGGSQGVGTVNATGLFVNGAATTTQTSGTFTGTLTGMTGSVTATFKWRKIGGSLVTLFLATGTDLTGTSNTTAMTLTGLPAAIQPAIQVCFYNASVEDNGGSEAANNCIAASGSTVTFTPAQVNAAPGKVVGGVFTASGTKGLTGPWQMIYDLGN
jgi:hypothetical protein